MSNTRKATGSKATGDAAVFDMDAARARRLESSGATLKFTWQDEEYEVPTPMEWDLGISERLAQGEVLEALQDLLGEEQFARFSAGKPTVGDLMGLMEWLGQQSLGSLGNS